MDDLLYIRVETALLSGKKAPFDLDTHGNFFYCVYSRWERRPSLAFLIAIIHFHSIILFHPIGYLDEAVSGICPISPVKESSLFPDAYASFAWRMMDSRHVK
jgi:hypothetical protein